MAVFTTLTKSEIEHFISSYSIGELISFEGILQGIDNTNYKIETTKDKYILTIFENRIDPNDLPFFLNFMGHLNLNGIICPTLLASLPESHTDSKAIQKMDSLRIDNVNSGNDELSIFMLHSKPAALFSFLDGRNLTANDITPALCQELGIFLAKMHVAGQKFYMTRENSMSFDAWEERLHRVGRLANSYLKILQTLKSKWPENLPSGVIHADLFPDNIFIKDNHIYGVIDFYFSCTDFLVYDLAIVMNAWCFEHQEFSYQKWLSLLEGYQSIRPLTQGEKDSYQIICQGAVLRFLSSRLHDFTFHDPKNLVTPKEPTEYIQKLEFHLNVKLF